MSGSRICFRNAYRKMNCSNCQLKGLCRSIRAKSREHFKWSIHNLVAHPLSEVAHLLGFTRLSDWLHEASIPVAAAPANAAGEPITGSLTTYGERVPPIEGDTPCDEYDPAGIGAGVEADGFPQCAMCGFSKSEHGVAEGAV
jgi:hypothetical protein